LYIGHIAKKIGIKDDFQQEQGQNHENSHIRPALDLLHCGCEEEPAKMAKFKVRGMSSKAGAK